MRGLAKGSIDRAVLRATRLPALNLVTPRKVGVVWLGILSLTHMPIYHFHARYTRY